MSLLRALGCSTLWVLAAADAAAAGSFSVTPVRIELAQGRGTAVLTLRNPEAAAQTLQVSLVDWSQVDGEDRYTPTHDLIATPPVFTVAANSEQIVRVALRHDADPSRELPYRIFIEQVPEAMPRDFTGLNVALRVGVPVFLQPKVPARSDLSWEMKRLADGTLRIDAINRGTAHIQVSDFDLAFAGADTKAHVALVKYVLPGSRMNWVITPPAGLETVSSATIHGFSDHGEFRAEIAIAPRH
jgi:fimbrial chaperone protein